MRSCQVEKSLHDFWFGFVFFVRNISSSNIHSCIAGLSNIGSFCNIGNKLSSGLWDSVSINRDKGLFGSTVTATHEMAHGCVSKANHFKFELKPSVMGQRSLASNAIDYFFGKLYSTLVERSSCRLLDNYDKIAYCRTPNSEEAHSSQQIYKNLKPMKKSV